MKQLYPFLLLRSLQIFWFLALSQTLFFKLSPFQSVNFHILTCFYILFYLVGVTLHC